MQDSYFEMIELYLERERLRYFRELELYKQETLDNFFQYHLNNRGDDWGMDRLCFLDRREYYHHLVKLSENRTLTYSIGRMKVIEDFLNFSVNMGWIKKNPWSTPKEVEE